MCLTLGAKDRHLTRPTAHRDGRGDEIGRGLRARDAERCRATDTIVMPGFVAPIVRLDSLFRTRRPCGGERRRLGQGRHHYQADDALRRPSGRPCWARERGSPPLVDWSHLAGDDLDDALSSPRRCRAAPVRTAHQQDLARLTRWPTVTRSPSDTSCPARRIWRGVAGGGRAPGAGRANPPRAESSGHGVIRTTGAAGSGSDTSRRALLRVDDADVEAIANRRRGVAFALERRPMHGLGSQPTNS